MNVCLTDLLKMKTDSGDLVVPVCKMLTAPVASRELS